MSPDRARASIVRDRRARVLKLALALRDTTAEGEQHLNFRVRKKSFAWLVDDHHGDGRVALHCKAEPGTNSALAEVHGERFFAPPYVGKLGWVGLWLDLAHVDWEEIEQLLRDAHALAAPARRRPASGAGDTSAGARAPRRRRRGR